jgi:hypothetical protein
MQRVLLCHVLLAVSPPVMRSACSMQYMHVHRSIQALGLPDCTDACIDNELNLQMPRQAIDLHLLVETHHGLTHDGCAACSVRMAESTVRESHGRTVTMASSYERPGRSTTCGLLMR